MKRRDFLLQSSLASGALLLPNFLKAFENPALNISQTDGKVLVIIQLSGGNDGLNTVVPFRNDIYYKERKRIAIAADKVLKLSDEQGFHPALQGLKEIFDDGNLSILNGVGYPNPDRSHFRSMDIWHTASDSNEYLNNGWIGRYLDNYCSGTPWKAVELDDTLSLSMKGENIKGIALKNLKQMNSTAKDKFLLQLANTNHLQDEAPVQYLYKTLVETTSSINYLNEKYLLKPTTAAYPTDAFGNDLKTVSSLILGGAATSVYYISLGSFDTHVGQPNRQEKLLKQLGDGVKVFMQDMKANNKLNDLLLMTFSEFGRRVSENASNGTDHGTANQMMLMGGGLKQKGILNAAPDLLDLDNGDLKFHTDFRQVYATILQQWLNIDAAKVLGKSFSLLNFV